MTATANTLLQEASRLSEEDRCELVLGILLSLEPEPSETDLAEWSAEIARRCKEVKEGKARLVPWQEVEARLDILRDRVPNRA